MMNICLHHRGVDAELLAILQSKIDRGLNKLWTQGGLQYAPPIR